jgi:hypothetical protein
MGLYELNGLNAPFGTFTATITETVAAGDFVKPVGSTELTTATYKTAATAAVKVELCNGAGNEALVCGISMDAKTYSATAVDNTVDVATRGIFLVPINAAVTIGLGVCLMADCGTQNYVTPSEAGGRMVGVALTPADTQGEYILMLMTGLGNTGAVA